MQFIMHHRSVKSISVAILLFCFSNNVNGAQARRLMTSALAVRASHGLTDVANLRGVSGAFELMKAGANGIQASEKLDVKRLSTRNLILYKIGEALLKENGELREQNAKLMAAHAKLLTNHLRLEGEKSFMEKRIAALSDENK